MNTVMQDRNAGDRPLVPRTWNERVQRVLIIRLRAIGDTVLCTPCLEVLKRWRPELEIDVLIEPLSAPILHGNPHITNLYVLPRSALSWRRFTERASVIAALRRRRYDLAIDLRGWRSSMIAMRLAGPVECAVFAHLPLSRVASIRVPDSRMIWGKAHVHNVEHQLAMLKWLGVPVEEIPWPRIIVDPRADERVARRLAEMEIGGRYAILHVGASNPSKIWAPARFARVAEYLWERYRLPSVVIAVPSEGHIAAAVSAAARCRPRVCTDLPLAETITLIARATLLLGNDSGPAHIAGAVGTPVAVIFGPTNPRFWGPWTPTPHRIVTPEIPEEARCPRCLFNACRTVPRCLDRIPVAQVTDALDGLLADIMEPGAPG